jgi:cadmium resistance protein CadD (predicted permease)
MATLLMAATAAYVSTNVDGYALLLGFFSNTRYRPLEIVAGQFASVTAQMVLAVAIMQSGWVRDAPFIGLAGIVPLVAGFKRIARLRRRGASRVRDREYHAALARGGVGRIATVTVIATSGAADNVLAYASLLLGRGSADILLVVATFGVLTAALCVSSCFTARSHMSMNSLRLAVARIAPFMTTAIGMSLLIRFDTLAWICSLA